MMQPGTYTLPPDAAPLFSLYEKLNRLTGGRMTPLIGQLLADAGYDADYSFERRHLRELPTWEAALEYAYPTLTIKQPGILDLGADGKGYLIDIIAAILHADGISVCIDAGGDILYHGDGVPPVSVSSRITAPRHRTEIKPFRHPPQPARRTFHHYRSENKASPRHLSRPGRSTIWRMAANPLLVAAERSWSLISPTLS